MILQHVYSVMPFNVVAKNILDRWLAPDHRYFKVRGDDGSTYILRHDMTSLDWELILFEEEKP